MDMNFANKVVIITGASSGIGQTTAVLFSRLGASLVIQGRNDDGLNSTIEQSDPSSRDRILKVNGDLRDHNVIRSIVDETIKKFGKIDVLVNNAGVSKNGTLEEMSMDDFDEFIDVNLRSSVYLSKLCLPHLVATKGAIVNVSSLLATRNYPMYTGYSISKAGLDKLTKLLSLELASKGVRVNSVNSGVVPTNIMRSTNMNEEEKSKFYDGLSKLTPLGRNGTPEEIAKLILYLASDNAGFITGELIHIDGGVHV